MDFSFSLLHLLTMLDRSTYGWLLLSKNSSHESSSEKKNGK